MGDDEIVSPSLKEHLGALVRQLDRIEAQVTYWRGQDHRVGHNGSPDAFRLEPSDADLVAVERSVAKVRAELAKPDRAVTADPAIIERAAGAFRRLAAKIPRWTKDPAHRFVKGLFYSAGTVAGAKIVSDPHGLYEVLDHAASTLSVWAAHLSAAYPPISCFPIGW
ncbi:hypothetical protein AA16373_1289 [Komagataeibacter swingsii DSM 16373]|nr:hypothetical protein AA16373_1289 [Komagataeibacter swingsii DSM 16373]